MFPLILSPGAQAPSRLVLSGTGRYHRGPVTKLPARDERPLVQRILDTPHLERVVPQLPAEVLHRVIEHCGLEDCGALVALATREQLQRVLDLDVWRARRPGVEERFDADRFAVWLEVLLDEGPEVASRQLAKMDTALVVTGLAEHVRVFDVAADVAVAGDAISAEIGGFVVVSKRGDGAWGAIVDLLVTLDAENPGLFGRLMGRCRHLSNEGFELDGLDDLLPDKDQAMFDLARDRERRREQQGFVTPEQARAFLAESRKWRPGDSAIARAYFRSADAFALPEEAEAFAPQAVSVGDLMDLLQDAGIVSQAPRALLHGEQGEAPKFARLQALLQRDADAYPRRTQELAFLANALASGCSVLGRPLTPEEASEAAAAVCNLALDMSPAIGDAAAADRDLVDVFQAGWTFLYEQVCRTTAERLVDVLSGLRCADETIQTDLDALRLALLRESSAGAPWRARHALEPIAALDMPAWAALLALIDEFPVLHAAIAPARGPKRLTIDAAAFEFISERRHVVAMRDFLAALPSTLSIP